MEGEEDRLQSLVFLRDSAGSTLCQQRRKSTAGAK